MVCRYKCIISYDGTYFVGYQIQPTGRTVQGEIEKVLKNMHKGRPMRVIASGRTDSGVHAIGQVIHFDSNLDIPVEGWKKGLNAQLPGDIFIKSVEVVEGKFHARYDVKMKEYRYRLLNDNSFDVFRRNYAYYYPYELDVESMRQAAKLIVGTHDFTSFCSARSDVEDKVRTVYILEISEDKDELVFRVVGNGFLYNMVRIIVGTLLEVGQGKINVNEINCLLEAKSRIYTGKTAPGHGLYLWKVDYNN